ncbi:hypothetical protein M6B38_353500 [Iris pallida]|uniref:Uncharacterized protein n=1 Tax=Iris pallida TaxID=29817 RepID=A0AAX6GPC5_IRIPA|nr:hypothetical protein M6B38_353500 [Iris pallida]
MTLLFSEHENDSTSRASSSIKLALAACITYLAPQQDM